ncbi:MAG: hypothetical protein GEV28_18265 [Actinophytocola sp.]|uniref:hypothetical protein n=1 Tax=Actinophytocola sp. TaxID=1872138 RepID=UPI001325DAE1|nr:hypothetical protein [Actinophytocola sp.]MPZ82231.1 hypothetical protein [Actinophytocola sp.]
MAAQSERPEDVAQEHRRSPAEVRASAVGGLAGLVRWVGLIFALVLVVHVLLTVGSANQDNGITVFFADTAKPLALAFKSLFTPENAELRVLVNYGLAALFWLIVSSVVSRLIRRLA